MTFGTRRFAHLLKELVECPLQEEPYQVGDLAELKSGILRDCHVGLF